MGSMLDTARSYLFPAGTNAWTSVTANDYIPVRRQNGSGATNVTADAALRHSAVWACLRLRANVVSATPVDAYDMTPDGIQYEVDKPQLLVNPGSALPAYMAGSTNGPLCEWLYSSQFDLDRHGNVFGVITERDKEGNPARVELVPTNDVTVTGQGQRIVKVRINNTTYDDPSVIWHERQYTIPGVPMGLSPIQYAAMSIGEYLEAAKFGLEYFNMGGAPSGVLRNTERSLVGKFAAEAKNDFKAAVQNRDIFVTGKDWEWSPANQQGATTAFLDARRYGVTDVARFFDVPADMIDAPSDGSHITYANVTQRNLQLLIIHMGPVFRRREQVLTSAIPRSRFVRFNTDALLRLDPETREKLILARVEGRTLAPSEARQLDNLAPFTPAQMAEFAILFPQKQAPSAAPAKEGAPAS